jgi:tRNA pseudouridine55 synthase
MQIFDGILLVDKPKGWTSFDVVAKVRGIISAEYRRENIESRMEAAGQQLQLPKRVKVGHTGTLDPSATGLLVICIGKATKLVTTMIKHDKTYEVEMTLGVTSSTGDQEGIIAKNIEARSKNIEEVNEILSKFVGLQMQTPPAYSAIKVDGKRAYELARAGKPVILEPRACTIHSIELTSYEWPVAKFTTSVSSGTYIRSLVEDIGTKLGTGAYMSNLRRTKVAKYGIEHSIAIPTTIADVENNILPILQQVV